VPSQVTNLLLELEEDAANLLRRVVGPSRERRYQLQFANSVAVISRTGQSCRQRPLIVDPLPPPPPMQEPGWRVNGHAAVGTRSVERCLRHLADASSGLDQRGERGHLVGSTGNLIIDLETATKWEAVTGSWWYRRRAGSTDAVRRDRLRVEQRRAEFESNLTV
jgi:hypothetical protein